MLEGERYLIKEGLHDDSICAGDIFNINDKIYINIRPDCDCIPDRNVTDSVAGDVELYLLRGTLK